MIDHSPASNAPTSGKKPLDPHLLSGPRGTVDDVRVQSGYPIWNLIGAWMATGYDDEALQAGYSDMSREEWEAAKHYYFDHKVVLDARIISNSQPADDDDTPPLRTVDEYYAWLLHENIAGSSDPITTGTPTHG